MVAPQLLVLFFILLSYLCEGILFYLCTETAWAPRRAVPQPLGWAPPAAAAGGTTWRFPRSHPSDTPRVPRLQYLALISETEKNTQTRQRGCGSSLSLLSNQRKDASRLLAKLQDPSSRYLQDNKEFVSLRPTVPHRVTNMDQNKRDLLDKAQKQELRKREEWIPPSSHFCPQQEQHLSLEKEQDPQSPCKVGAQSAAHKYFKPLWCSQKYFRPLSCFQVSLGQLFPATFPSEDGRLGVTKE